MTHTELVNATAKAVGITQDQAEEVLKAADGIALEALQGGDEVHVGFGKLERTHREERPGRNPATGEAITIAASYGLKLKPSAAVKRALNP